MNGYTKAAKGAESRGSTWLGRTKEALNLSLFEDHRVVNWRVSVVSGRGWEPGTRLFATRESPFATGERQFVPNGC